MDSDIPAQQDSTTWGSPPNPRWSTRQTLAAVGIAAVIAGLGGAAIFAATGNASHAMGPGGRGGASGRWGGPDGGPGPGGMPGGPGGPGGQGDPGGPGGAGRAAPLHGEFVVSDDNGGYITQVTQIGVVTFISDTSITAKSADGFTQSYVLEPDAAKGQPAVNDTVNIRATKADGQLTATAVFEGGGMGRPGGPPPR